MQVLNNGNFKHLNEGYGPHSAVLEFQTVCDGILINGVDMVNWNSDGLITRFKVMVRPLKALGKLHERMGQMLDATASTATGLMPVSKEQPPDRDPGSPPHGPG